jgi:hypothetical protein
LIRLFNLLFVMNRAHAQPFPTLMRMDPFASTNAELEEYGIRYNATNDVVEFRGPVDGKWGPMKATEITMFAQDQIYKGKLTDLGGPGGFVETSSEITSVWIQSGRAGETSYTTPRQQWLNSLRMN